MKWVIGVKSMVKHIFSQGDLCGIAAMLKSSNGFIIPKMIVYVQTKDMAWKVYSFLQRESEKRCYVTVYHANLTQTTKSMVYQEFSSPSSSVRCLVATVAFGMVCGKLKNNIV